MITVDLHISCRGGGMGLADPASAGPKIQIILKINFKSETHN